MGRNTIADSATVDALRHVLRALILSIRSAEGINRAMTFLNGKIAEISLFRAADASSGITVSAIAAFGGSNPLFI